MTDRSPPPGAWPSWVTPDLVAGKTIGLSTLRTCGETLYWLESRPTQRGRTILVSATTDGTITDITDDRFDIGTRVHEYGGGAYTVARTQDGPTLLFSDRQDGNVWLITPATTPPRKIVGAPGLRFADFAIHPSGQGAYAIREDHRDPTKPEPANTIVWLDFQNPTDSGTTLVTGADFYSSPRPSPDGTQLAWIAWSHPNMPWNDTCLQHAPLADTPATLGAIQTLANGEQGHFSVIEPRWTQDNRLIAATDETGFWNPKSYDPTLQFPNINAEIGLPHWIFGQQTFTPLKDGSLLCLAIREGLNTILRLTSNPSSITPLTFGHPSEVPQPLGQSGLFAWIDTPPDAPPAIAIGAPGSPPKILRTATTLPENLPRNAISCPDILRFPTKTGDAYALFYPPGNPDHSLGTDEKPPLVVMAHGGPTGRSNPAFSFKIQWWTSRGFAVLDVNYRGSTGFGRTYREQLDEHWGLLDVTDCLDAVRFVIARNMVDPARCVIRGSSAGGLTVLECLAHSTLFAAATSLYGVTDLRALAHETHKFEARYLDRLIGPYPETLSRYLDRSPLSHPEKIQTPILFLHGSEDKVVPPKQAEDMVHHLKARNIPVEHHVYPNEAHGFRAETAIKDALLREWSFYNRVFSTLPKPDQI